VSQPPQSALQAARDIFITCPDCPGFGFIKWSKPRQRWVIAIYHMKSCVTRRRAASRRACERDVTDLLAGPLRLAQYDPGGSVIDVDHRMARPA
jgi:hypothetical protein